MKPELNARLPGLAVRLPRYVAMIRNGSTRVDPVPEDIVALNTFDVINRTCGLRKGPKKDVREHFKIPDTSKLVLVSVNQDSFVEAFWAHRTEAKLSTLARLGIDAMTTPNFSLFEDAPRLHSVRNLWRIVRSAEYIAKAGIRPILHVNASTAEDWEFWVRVLKASPEVDHICKEFQTGLRSPEKANDAILGLKNLQEAVGRPLHPVVVGGQRVASRIASSFGTFTLIDSVPFMATIKRKRITVCGAQARQLDHPTPRGALLDGLLQDNVRTYREMVALASPVQVPDEWLEAEYAGTAPLARAG